MSLQDTTTSSSSKSGAEVVLVLLVGSLIINAAQHAFHSSQMEMLKQASDGYEKKFEKQEQTIAQLQNDKAVLEGKLQGYIWGRR